MKNLIKPMLSRTVVFIACNLLIVLVGVIGMLIAGLLAYQELMANRILTNLIFYVVMTVGFIFPFYIFYFLKNAKYKRLYLNSSADGHSIKSIMKMHINSFAKYELPILLIISVVFLFVPDTDKSGMSLLVASASFFMGYMQNFLFESTSIIFRFICLALWDIYIVIIYFVCLRMAYRRWKKKRLKKSI